MNFPLSDGNRSLNTLNTDSNADFFKIHLVRKVTKAPICLRTYDVKATLGYQKSFDF